jgi:tetratricopeptide (TPR) repeat protein
LPAFFPDNKRVTPGRNDPCSCGSTKKYKRCCGERTAATPTLSAEAYDAQGSALLARGEAAQAAQQYRQALALKPDFAEAHGNLGNALTDLGQWDEAIEHYRQMLRLRPEVAEAHNNLGNALLSQQRFAEAAASYTQAIALRPRSAGALINLANALRETGQANDALTACRRALELQPQLADAYLIRGTAQFDLGLLDDAVQSYSRALELDPSLVRAHIALAMVLRQIGRAADAEVRCRQALKVDPASAEALALLGELRADFGHFTEAESYLRKALEIDPNLPAAWAGLARYRKMGDGDAQWLSAAQRLASRPLSLGQEINLRFAIGKYFDDCQDFESAFANYQRGNELKKRAALRHDPAQMSRRVDEVIRLYSRRWLLQAEAAGSQSSRPVFIVGMPRSGTSLTEQILDSHPEVHGAGELRFWHAATVKFEAQRRRGEDGIGAIAGIARDALSHLNALSAHASRVIDKMPANFLNLGLIHAAFPNARIIHMQRHPLDTALSIYFQVFSNTHSYSNDLEHIAGYYAEYQRLMQHWHQVLPKGAILDVPYEELVAEPDRWSRRLVKFIELPWDPACLDFHQTQRVVTTASNWQVRQKITQSSAGRWRHYARHLEPLRRFMNQDLSA